MRADVELEPVGYVMAALPAGQANFAGEMASEPAALLESNARGRLTCCCPPKTLTTVWSL